MYLSHEVWVRCSYSVPTHTVFLWCTYTYGVPIARSLGTKMLARATAVAGGTWLTRRLPRSALSLSLAGAPADVLRARARPAAHGTRPPHEQPSQAKRTLAGGMEAGNGAGAAVTAAAPLCLVAENSAAANAQPVGAAWSSEGVGITVPAAAEPAAAASMFSSLPDPPGVFYEALLAVHSTTGLGWAGTFVLSTVLMRIGMLPLSVFSDRNSRKFNAKVTPELFKLWKDLSPVDTLGNPRKFESNSEFWKLQRVAFGAARKLWRRHTSHSSKSPI